MNGSIWAAHGNLLKGGNELKLGWECCVSFAVVPWEPMGLAGGHQRAFSYCWVCSLLVQKWLTKTCRDFLIRKSLQKRPHRNNKLFNSVRVVEGKMLQSS